MTKKKRDPNAPRREAEPWKDGRKPAVTCVATNKAGFPCKKPPIKGSTVCRMHGGAAPHVRAAAQVRILMSSDLAAAKLIELMTSRKVDDRVKLAAAKDLLDRANLAGKQSIEVGVVQPKSFEDWVGDAIVDVGELEPAAPDAETVDAEIVEPETDDERWALEDALSERQREHKRLTAGSRPTPPRNPDRDRAEAAAIRKPMRSTSTDDPYADRFPEQNRSRSMSPKRYAQRHNDGD